MRHIVLLVAAPAVLLFAFACSSSDDGRAELEEGVPTGATCPPSSSLTYESFGRGFMEAYCTRCHSSALSGAARNEAPEGHDFDTLDGVLAVAEHIDEYAAAGPAGVNGAMPPSSPSPSEDDRRKLGEWLACEVVSQGGAGAGGDAGAHD